MSQRFIFLNSLLAGLLVLSNLLSCTCNTNATSDTAKSTPESSNLIGNTYYVAKDGSDGNPGTEALPWLTISHAAQTLVAGDTVYVKNGTYYENVSIIINSGSAKKPITFANYPGQSPIIDGTNLTDPGYETGLVFISQAYIIVEGFEIRNSPKGPNFSGVYNYQGHHNIFRKLKIHGISHSGIKLQSAAASEIVIDGCEIFDTNRSLQDETISLMPASNVEIENCIIHDSPKEGINCKDGSQGVSIHDNEIYNITGDSGIYVDCGGRSISCFMIYRNKIHNNINGMALASEISPGDLTGVSIYNNLIYNNNRGFVAYPYSFHKTVSLINNTFYHNGLTEIDWADTAVQYQVNCIERNNLVVGLYADTSLSNYPYYDNGGVNIDHNLFYDAAGYSADNKYGTNYVQANPLLINPIFDFGIPPNSPAKDSGSPNDAPATDYVGTTRPSGAGFDIGAYECPVSRALISRTTTKPILCLSTNLAPLSYLVSYLSKIGFKTG